ncbi:hypothetical protein EDB80DRAFT_690386 [Ilyonectria destructans]|nr:hypothetical protein EDB80DRAFT_690386 [Ilyonectria destructans]
MSQPGAATEPDSNQSTPMENTNVANKGNQVVESAQRQAILGGGPAGADQGVQVLEMVAHIVISDSLKGVFDTWGERDLETHVGSCLVPLLLDTIKNELRDSGSSNAVTDIRTPHLVFEKEPVDVLNDVLVIFPYETFSFYSVHFRDQVTLPGFQTRRRLNDAIGALFAFFLGRPPRISKRHCMIHMPLHLDIQAFRLASDSMNEELSRLDQNGWNRQSEIRIFAVLRWSLITSKIREEILEAMLGPEITERQQLIR